MAGTPSIRLRPVTPADLAMFERFAVEPGLIGLDWWGYRDAQEPGRRFAADGYLGDDGGRLVVESLPDDVAAGFVSWTAGRTPERAATGRSGSRCCLSTAGEASGGGRR